MSNSLKICEYTAFQRLLIRWCRDEQLALEGLKLWLSEIGHAPLYALDSQTVSLADLRAGDYLTEFDFTFPSLELNSAQFNAQVCIPQARDEVGEAAAAELTLNEQLISGYLTGQIDLFCALPAEHGRKYYVLDYKSTYLGNHYQDYNEDALRQSVFSPQNRYDVQFLIYTLAAHRYLSSRLADYDYERDFGGVIYLYVRALRSAGQSSPGVFFIKPKFEYLQKLDALCQGGGE